MSIIGLAIAIRGTWLAMLRATVLALLLIPGPRFLSLGRLDQPAVGDRVGHTRLLRECLVVGLDGVLVTAGARQRIAAVVVGIGAGQRLPCIDESAEHTHELQSLMRISYAVFLLHKKKIHL